MNRDRYMPIRVKFSQLAIKDNKKAAQELRNLADGLENCRNTSDVVNALTQIFACSERTIFNDLVK